MLYKRSLQSLKALTGVFTRAQRVMNIHFLCIRTTSNEYSFAVYSDNGRRMWLVTSVTFFTSRISCIKMMAEEGEISQKPSELGSGEIALDLESKGVQQESRPSDDSAVNRTGVESSAEPRRSSLSAGERSTHSTVSRVSMSPYKIMTSYGASNLFAYKVHTSTNNYFYCPVYLTTGSMVSCKTETATEIFLLIETFQKQPG